MRRLAVTAECSKIRAGKGVLSAGGSTHWIECSISQRGASQDGLLQCARTKEDLQ
jgi:hypothetical protein